MSKRNRVLLLANEKKILHIGQNKSDKTLKDLD